MKSDNSNRIDKMKLFKISQTVNNGYDTYDSAVVVAECKEDAQRMHPGYSDTGGIIPEELLNYVVNNSDFQAWAHPKFVSVEYLGEAADGMQGVVCASYNG